MSQKSEYTNEALSDDIKEIVSDLVFRTFLSLLYTGQLLNKYIDLEAKKFGSNRPRVDVLHSIIVHGGVMTQSELSEVTFRSKQSTAELVDALEKDGLIRRRIPRNDRRTKEVIVTNKGLDLLKQTVPHALNVVKRIMPPTWSPQQLREFRSRLKQIRNLLLEQITSGGVEE